MKHLYLALLLCIGLAHAEIYKHVDKDGRITYSNIPMKGSKKLDLDHGALIPAPNSTARSSTSSSGERRASIALPSPSNFPRVDSATQSERDQGRRQILLGEVANEEKLLNEARQKLSSAPNDSKIKDSVRFHEGNLAMLRQELARIK